MALSQQTAHIPRRQTMAMTIWQDVKVFWKTIVVLATLLIMLPFIFIFPYKEVECGFVMALMAVYWMTEALPMGVTGFIPIFIFPLMGILSMSVIAGAYMRNIQLTLIGVLMVARSVELCNLHRRVALGVLLLVGTSPRRLLLGVMLATWFLSMWVANIATTAMMIPVVEAIITELTADHAQTNIYVISDVSSDDKTSSDSEEKPKEQPASSEEKDKNDLPTDVLQVEAGEETTDCKPTMEFKVSPNPNNSKAVCKMLSIAICYSSNIGGIATLIGSGTNMVAYDMWEEHYEERGLQSPVTYATWIPAALPVSALTLLLTWVWLQAFFLRGMCLKDLGNHGDAASTRRIIQRQYDKLGHITFAEVSNIVFFLILTCLWFFREPGFMPGYAELLPNNYVTDAVPAALIAVLLFIFPSEKPKLYWWRKPGESPRSVPGLLEWSTTVPHLGWSAFFIIGAGFALSEASNASGLSDWLGSQLESLSHLDPWLIAFLASLLVGALTQLMSNLATISLILPLLLTLADSIGAHPLHLTMPVAFVASGAFMLPASTVPNAMVFESGHLKVIDMVLCGFVTNAVFILVTFMGTETWMSALFNFSEHPWNNSTLTPER